MAASLRILVLISGNGSNLQAIIDSCEHNANADIIAVISDKADAYGLVRAKQHQIATRCISAKASQSREDYDDTLKEVIDDLRPDLIVLAGFMRILSQEFVTHFEGRTINIHPSLLPKYPGLHTHQRAIDHHDNQHGASVHFVIPELDAGPVILQAKIPIHPQDDAQTLANRVRSQEHIIYPLVIKWFIQGRLQMVDRIAYLDKIPLGANGYVAD